MRKLSYLVSVAAVVTAFVGPAAPAGAQPYGPGMMGGYGYGMMGGYGPGPMMGYGGYFGSRRI